MTKYDKLKNELANTNSAHNKAVAELRAAEDRFGKAGSAVDQLEAQRGQVEDEIFAAFSKSVGVASVREYEETSLRRAREREEHLLELKQQESKLQARLQFEQRKDLPAAAAKLEAAIGKDEETIKRKQDSLTKASADADELKQKAAKV